MALSAFSGGTKSLDVAPTLSVNLFGTFGADGPNATDVGGSVRVGGRLGKL